MVEQVKEQYVKMTSEMFIFSEGLLSGGFEFR